MIYYLISFQKPSSERILITQVVDFSFIDISVERVTGLENDSDETIWINVIIQTDKNSQQPENWINVRARGQTFLFVQHLST